ncbi:hypothetical protein [Ferviditalea candida]|uniref:Uncharacterized protein n=1 Tax=Ferviditalea candida TaxID=3108399 RepID=A0ABU5ZE44_9BACL|nr:hypothetical protein [Paenibacillaceae bacterium T2]
MIIKYQKTQHHTNEPFSLIATAVSREKTPNLLIFAENVDQYLTTILQKREERKENARKKGQSCFFQVYSASGPLETQYIVVYNEKRTQYLEQYIEWNKWLMEIFVVWCEPVFTGGQAPSQADFSTTVVKSAHIF